MSATSIHDAINGLGSDFSTPHTIQIRTVSSAELVKLVYRPFQPRHSGKSFHLDYHSFDICFYIISTKLKAKNNKLKQTIFQNALVWTQQHVCTQFQLRSKRKESNVPKQAKVLLSDIGIQYILCFCLLFVSLFRIHLMR